MKPRPVTAAMVVPFIAFVLVAVQSSATAAFVSAPSPPPQCAARARRRSGTLSLATASPAPALVDGQRTPKQARPCDGGSATTSTTTPTTRRRWFQRVAAAALATGVAVGGGPAPPPASLAAETVGKDPDCNDGSCLGVWDGLLADCPHGRLGGAGCASSQDDTPGVFAEPWDYAEAPNGSLDWEDQMRLLIPTIQLVSSRRGDMVKVLLQSGRYLRVLFTDGKTGEKSTGEFYFTPDDSTVQFRLGSMGGGGGASLFSSSLKNLERCELIRKELRFLKVPVLRNRKRALFFVESDLDTFGPGSAALGPPAEMKTGELEGRQDVDPKLKIDLLQTFPMAK